MDGLVADPEAVLDRRAHVLDQHVGGVYQAHQHVKAGRGLKVEGQRPLVAVDLLEVAAVPVTAERVRHARQLDADHVRAPVSELPDAGVAPPAQWSGQ